MIGEAYSQGHQSPVIPSKFLDDSRLFPYAPRRETSPHREGQLLFKLCLFYKAFSPLQ
jgi:hypothetical protein